jgi:integrase
MARRRPNTRIKNDKLQVYVRVHPGPGGLKSTTMERTATDAEVQTWIADTIKKYAGAKDTGASLRAMVDKYVAQRQSMPTIRSVTATLYRWLDDLGPDRAPLAITTHEISAILDRYANSVATWRTTKLKKTSVRARRTTLLAFYNTMYPNRPNPVTGSPSYRTPDPTDPYDMNFLDIEAGIAAIPDIRARTGRRCMTKIRLRCMAYTGLPPAVLKRIRPADLNFVAGTLRVARDKGHGIPERVIYLSPDALAAFKDFHAENLYGWFATSGANIGFQRGCKRAGVTGHVWLYRIRHSFLTQEYRVTGDTGAVARAALHAPGSKYTARYTKGAHEEVDRAAAAAFSESLAQMRRDNLKSAPNPAAPVHNRYKKLPKKVAQTRKAFQRVG